MKKKKSNLSKKSVSFPGNNLNEITKYVRKIYSESKCECDICIALRVKILAYSASLEILNNQEH